MYKKTKVRKILYLLSREISASEIAETLHVSINTVAHIKNTYENNEIDIEELYLLYDDQMYSIFYPKKFAPRNRFVPVDYGYVHKELKRIGVNETLLWEEYRDKCISECVRYCCFATFHQQTFCYFSTLI